MVNVVIITGFLGAGKTTFLRAMRESGAWSDEKWAVVVNEFGKVGIDGSLLQSGSAVPVVEISDGCLCCTLKGDFQDAVRKLIAVHQPDRILIEPSGIFALAEMADLFAIPPLSDLCRIQAVIAIVDPGQFTSTRLRNNYFVENQIRHANLLVTSKSGKHSPETELLALEGLKGINAEAHILTGPWEDFDFGWFRTLLEGPDETGKVSEFLAGGRAAAVADQGSSSAAPAADQEADQAAGPIKSVPAHGDEIGIQSFGLRELRDLTGSEYQLLLDDMVRGEYGEVLRMKGYLRVDGVLREINHVFGDESFRPDLGNQAAAEQPTKISIVGKQLHVRRLNRSFWSFQTAAFGKVDMRPEETRNGV